MPTAVEALTERQDAVLVFLREAGQISLAIEFEESYRKLLVMACGSFFEAHLTDHLCDFALAVADLRIAQLVKNKGLKRQYHSLFTWDAANVNTFLGLFGEEFKTSVAREIVTENGLMLGMRSFLLLGSERNKLAHGNLGAVSTDLTIDEIKRHYDAAWNFLQFLCGKLAPLTEPALVAKAEEPLG
jgi:hypothetical protein